MWLAQPLPLSFSESMTAFSKLRQEAVASELRGMDAAYERCVKKAVITIFPKE